MAEDKKEKEDKRKWALEQAKVFVKGGSVEEVLRVAGKLLEYIEAD